MKKKTRKQKRTEKMRRYILKKPVFKKIFLSKAALLLFIAIVIIATGTYISGLVFKTAKVDFAEEKVQNIREHLTDLGDENLDDEAIWKSSMKWPIATSTVLANGRVEIYDAETREEYLNSDPCVLAVIRKGRAPLRNDERETRETHLLCESPLEAWMPIYKKYEYVADDMSKIKLKSFYLKDAVLYPGKVQIVTNNLGDETDSSKEEVLEEFSMQPEHPEEYEYVESSEEGWHRTIGPVLLGADSENVLSYQEEYDKTIRSAFDATMEEMYDDIWADVRMETTSGQMIDGSKLNFNFLSYENFVLANGKKVCMVMVAHYDMFEEYGRILYPVYAGILLLAILIALFWSQHNYLLRKTQYQMDQYRRETTNAMAHDLKTPLTAISGFAENLRDNVHTEKKDYYAETILDNVQYMNGMIANILELAKVENTEYKPERTKVDLAVVTGEVLKKQEIMQEEKNLEVLVDGNAEIHADRSRIAQAIENLVGNAVNYAPNDSTIFISIKDTGYEVKNAMQGTLDIPADELWKPFVKGDNSRSGNRGTGIGLAIVKNIADAHGYTLELAVEEGEFVARLRF